MSATLNAADIDRKLTAEYVDESRDVLNELDVRLGNVRAGALDSATVLDEMRRQYFSLRLGARAAGLPAADVIALRLVEYAGDLTKLGDKAIDDLQVFHDRLRAALAGEIADADTRSVVRSLPISNSFDLADVTIQDVEIMLAEPQRATRRIFERELRACGYRVSNITRSYEAIEQAVRTKPDMIICSLVLDELSGIDLACALTAMPATQSIPVALLTSYGLGHPALAGLPARVAIIRKDHHFGDDLAEALARFSIT